MLSTASTLTPLQLTAAGDLLQNQGLSASTLDNAVMLYTSTNLIASLANTIAVGNTGNILNANNIASLVTLTATNCPALSDSIPSASANAYPVEIITTLLTNTANTYLGNGDLSKFAQSVAIASGYCSTTNQFINSTVNSQQYLSNTFINQNSLMSGGITDVNICIEQWGGDLANLGSLINLGNLDELGTPLALVKQLASLGGITPAITTAFTAAGVTIDVVVNLTSPSVTTSDNDQKAMYNAMTQITGTDLQSVMTILGVTTANINTMADLLNPYKIFPNSFQSLTVMDVNKVSQNIYMNSAGTVNSTLYKGLPSIALNTLS
jgi:hypothetical protein